MSSLVADPLSELTPASLSWLWEPYLPRGKLAIFDGDPGIGKSLVTLDLAARLSRAGTLPGGTTVDRPQVTLLLSVEDGSRDTVRPRAEAAGADLARLRFVRATSAEPILFPQRIGDLEELIRTHAADLVVIDPIMAFLAPEAAANLDQCVRRVLNPLAALAERADCAILLVRHLRKLEATRAVYRGQGSMGFIAAARTGWLAARDPSDPTRGVLTVTKTNVPCVPPSLVYRLQSNPTGHAVIEWVTTAALSADVVARTLAPLRMSDRAAEWLHRQLAGGPRKATDVYAAGAEVGIPERTLERAKQVLGAKSYKFYGKDQAVWYWYDPAVPWPANAPFKKPNPHELPPLEFN